MKCNKTLDLEDIKKLFFAVPLVFILFLTLFCLAGSYAFLEYKKNKEIAFLSQKAKLDFEYQKKETLQKFVLKVHNDIDQQIYHAINAVEKQVYKFIGKIENHSLKNVQTMISSYEKNSQLKLTLVHKKSLNVIYDSNNLTYLQKLIFGSVHEQFKTKVIEHILEKKTPYVKEWDDSFGNLKVSFFEQVMIDGEVYYLGAFSKNIYTYILTKNVVKNAIKNLDKNSDYDIWFMDLKTKVTYNYFNKHEFINFNQIKPDENLKYEILNYYIFNDHDSKKFDKLTHVDKKFLYMLAIDYNTNLVVDTAYLSDYYDKLLLQSWLFIFLLVFALAFFSWFFSRFIKRSIDVYSDESRDKKDSFIHWKNRFEFSVMALNAGLWDIDFQTQKLYFSNKWFEMTGYSRNDVVNFPQWFDLIHPEDKAKVEKIFEKIFLMHSDTFMAEYRIRTKSGEYKWMKTKGKLFREEQGAYTNRMLMMSMDIHEKKVLTKDLMEWEALFDEGELVVFHLKGDENLSVQGITKSIKTFGYFPFDFEEAGLTFMKLIHKSDYQKVKDAFDNAKANGLKSFMFSCRILNALGEIKLVSCRVMVVKDTFGGEYQFYGYMQDKNYELLSLNESAPNDELINENLASQEQKMMQQSKLASMGEMVGFAMHQWKEPLNKVSLFIQFLNDNYKNNEVSAQKLEEYFSRASQQVKYMNQTIDGFRNFYKASQSITQFQLDELIESVLDIVRTPLEEVQITLYYNCPRIKIINYENELKQAILNILNNAKDALLGKKDKENYTPLIELEVYVYAQKVEINLYNNGGSIPQEIQHKIFRPYFTTKVETKGTGIGLYMTKTLVEKYMEGTIEVFNINNGVNFKITLPLEIGA